MPAELNPPAQAASIPASASSTTRQTEGSSPINCAAFKKTSGLGLECVMLLPSDTASKYLRASVRSSMSGVFLLDEPIASYKPAAFSDVSVERTSSDTSAGDIFCNNFLYASFFLSARAPYFNPSRTNQS